MSGITPTRHLPIFNPYNFLNLEIHIIGAGATGSRLWLSLIELGLQNITVYDDDIVEAHNLANQIYLKEDIGEPKVLALQKYYTRKTGLNPPDGLKFKNYRVDIDADISLKGIVFLLTDTMHSRINIYDHFIKHNEEVLHVIETRMASTHGNIFTFNNHNITEKETWFASLEDDESTETSACGASISVGPTASIIANLAVWQMILILTEPNGVNNAVNIFLKPLIVSME